MLTSVGLRGDAKIAQECSLSAYLTKPVRQSDLYATLQNVLSNSKFDEPSQLVTKYSIAEEMRRFDLTVLVAEDNETNQAVVNSMLKKLGCRVSIASNGREGVDAVSTSSYDLIFMDCQMPVMDGYEATRQIRKQEKFKEMPVIAMTANAMKGDKEKVLAAGMNDHIPKPFKIDTMYATLAKWIKPGKH